MKELRKDVAESLVPIVQKVRTIVDVSHIPVFYRGNKL